MKIWNSFLSSFLTSSQCRDDLSLLFCSPKGQTIDDIPSAVIEDAAQLVKANSIEGCKRNNIDVVYTMWENLKKTPAMDVGQVSFHRDKDVRKIRVEKKINEIVNRLNKTKTESHPGEMLDRNDFRSLLL